MKWLATIVITCLLFGAAAFPAAQQALAEEAEEVPEALTDDDPAIGSGEGNVADRTMAADDSIAEAEDGSYESDLDETAAEQTSKEAMVEGQSGNVADDILYGDSEEHPED